MIPKVCTLETLKLSLFLFMCTSVNACTGLCAPHTCASPWKPEEGAKSLDTVDRRVCPGN